MLVGIATLFAGCSNGAGRETSPPQNGTRTEARPETGTGPPVQDVVQFTIDTLPQLAGGMPLGGWKREHTADTIEAHAPRLAVPFNEHWCARAISAPPSPVTLTRMAYFYPPASDSASLPSNPRSGELIDQCRLGLLWTEIEHPDPDTFAGGVQQALVNTLGDPDPPVKLYWFGSSYWRHTAHWRLGRTSVVTGVAPGREVFVAAAAEASGLRFDRAPDAAGEQSESRRQHLAVLARIDEALTLAGIGGPAEADARAAVKILGPSDGWDRMPSEQEQSTVQRTVVRLVSASRALPLDRRAAALFAGDQLLEKSGLPPWKEDQQPAARRDLAAVGATFNWSPLGDVYTYTHPWLKQAWEMNSEGRIGELSLLTLMEMGFETSGTCADQSGKGFRAVIERGGDLLRRRPDSSIRSDVHLLMARAYGDIVALDSGLSPYVDAGSLAGEATAARAQAIAHYRAFFNQDRSSERHQLVWPDAWRLMAGLAPTRTYFYCVYD